MEKRKLGNSDIAVSKMGLGCWIFGTGDYWGSVEQEETNRIVGMALDNGINYFDTAEAYNDGNSEIALGKALKGHRDEVCLLTKLCPDDNTDNLIPRFEAQLKRLDTDYIDILMVHWPHQNDDITREALRIFDGLKKDGKVREIGVSNFGVHQMGVAIETGVVPCINELPYNLISRAIDYEILPMCIKENIGVSTYSTLQQGVLTGKYKSPEEIPAGPGHSRHFSMERGQGTSRHNEDGAEKEIFTLIDEMRKISDETGYSVADLAIAWNMQRPGISSAIVGARTCKQLERNLKAVDCILSDDLMQRLVDLSEPVLAKLGNSADYYSNRAQGRVK